MLVAASPALAAEPEVTVTAPNGGEDWGAGSVQALHWQLNAPVSSGEFYAWVIDASGTWYDAAQGVAALAR